MGLSNALFAAPILFSRKADRGLQFYVNYQKLNAITKKNYYPLPLINKTLAWLSYAKIFTKIDIQQAFHCIHIYPDSKDLTTF